MIRKIGYEEIAVTMAIKGYPVHTRTWMLNIIGVRSNDQTPYSFDDCIIFFRFNGYRWEWMQTPATTDPGLYYLEKPLRKEGTIIMCPGHYENLYYRGFHKGKPAFRQRAKAEYIRDNNKDEYLDLALMKDKSKRFYANALTNLHGAHDKYEVQRIGKYSAGCQVVQPPNDFRTALKWGDEQVKKTGVQHMNYTLLLEKELITFDDVK